MVSKRKIKLGWVVALIFVAALSTPQADAQTNAPPIFLSEPPTVVDHNREYEYAIDVDDGNDDQISVNIEVRPAWLQFDEIDLTLTGVPDWDNIGFHFVRIAASDGDTIVRQTFVIQVAKGEIVCNSDFGDPAQSPYVLPYGVGSTYNLILGNCPVSPASAHFNWFAYDFDMPTGTPVLAARSGRVLSVQEAFEDSNSVPGNENFVFIEHADGTVMQYAHLTKDGALVEVGEIVEQGQRIGFSGETGTASGPSLHVALFRDATDFDRKATLPLNFSNADGPLGANGSLIIGSNYTALPLRN